MLDFAAVDLTPGAGTLSGVILSVTIYGIAIALVLPSTNTALFAATPEASHGVVSGINNACGRAATLLAIAGYGAVANLTFSEAALPEVATVGLGAGDALQGAAGVNLPGGCRCQFFQRELAFHRPQRVGLRCRRSVPGPA